MASSEPSWHPEALREAQEARDWYARRSGQAARGFLTSLEQAITAVAEAPDRYPKTRHGCRRFVFLNRYPFDLVFRVDGERIHVVAVAHHRRRPGYWRNR